MHEEVVGWRHHRCWWWHSRRAATARRRRPWTATIRSRTSGCSRWT